MGRTPAAVKEMTKVKEGYHNYALQIPVVLWNRLCKESEETGQPITKIVTEMLQARYEVKDSELPAPKRVGRRPSRK